MSHQRQLIREAAKAALLNQTAAGTRVYETRVLPLRRPQLPAVNVYTLEESSDHENTAPRELTRRMQLAIEAHVKQGANVDDAIDDISVEIERAMHADETLGGTCSDSFLSGTKMDFMTDGDQPIGLVRLTYEVTYYTYAPDAADVTVDDLATANIRHNLGGEVHVDDEAVDQVENLDV